jgi:hypothetical protein
MLLHTLGEIAARSKHGAAKYQAVVISVSYDEAHPYETSKMRALLTSLGFEAVTLYKEGTNQLAKDASNKAKRYMIVHNHGGGQKWWSLLASKLAGLPAVCPRTSGLGVGLCS